MEAETRIQSIRPGEEGTLAREAPNGREIVAAFLAGIDAKPSTKRGYGKAMKLYLGWVSCSGRSMREVTQDDIIAYKEDLLSREPQLSSLTVAFYLSSVRRFYVWAESRKLYPNVAAGVRRKYGKTSSSSTLRRPNVKPSWAG